MATSGGLAPAGPFAVATRVATSMDAAARTRMVDRDPAHPRNPTRRLRHSAYCSHGSLTPSLISAMCTPSGAFHSNHSVRGMHYFANCSCRKRRGWVSLYVPELGRPTPLVPCAVPKDRRNDADREKSRRDPGSGPNRGASKRQDEAEHEGACGPYCDGISDGVHSHGLRSTNRLLC
jgi:hypothetical protein